MGFFGKKDSDAVVEPVVENNDAGSGDDKINTSEQTSEVNFGEKQEGVKRVEALASVWTKRDLIASYVLIWFIYLATSAAEVITRSLNPNVTSAFGKHSLSAGVTVVSSIIGGLTKLPLAKALDLWGRPQGLALMLLVWVIGYILTASAQTIETYAAANVFTAVGAQGVSYCVTVFIADTSSLAMRPLMLAIATSPYIITTFIGGPVADLIIAPGGPGWRWGFGIWTIIVPVFVAPLIGLFMWHTHRAKQMGLIQPRGKVTLGGVKKFCVDIDLFGLLLLATGMTLFLLPFNIYSYQAEKWRSPLIICFLVFGFVLLVCFAVWERFFAPVTFVPFKLLLDRTVFFGGLTFTFVFANSMIWNGFFFSMLQVVWNTGIRNAIYISNIYRVGSCFAPLITGYFTYRTGRFKWVATLYGIPLMLLAVGLMIHFRRASQDIGYIVMTQIFVAFAGGPIVVAGEMAMMAPSDHQHIAVIIAILDLFSSIGWAIGGSVSSAIWTGTFPKELAKRLPADAPLMQIYSSLPIQLSYPFGSPIRDAINDAYSASQRYMLTTSICLLAVAWGCSWLWRDINIKKRKQVEGVVA